MNTIILNTITNDSEKAKPVGFEIANNNSTLIKNNSGDFQWLELTAGKVLYGSLSGVTVIDTNDIIPFKSVSPSGYSKDLIVPSNNADDCLLLGHDYSNSNTPYDNSNSGTTYMTMIFDTNKGVFRVGSADSEYDDANVGIQTLGIGSSRASGTGSMFLGSGNNITGQSSIVIGSSNTVDSDNTLIVGNNNNTNGHSIDIFGDSITSYNDNGILLGKKAHYSDALNSVNSYSGKFTSTVYGQGTGGYVDLYINYGGGSPNVRGLNIDTSKKGMIELSSKVAILDTSGTVEYRYRRLYAILYWNIGDTSLTVASRSSQNVFGSGSTHQARIATNGTEVYIQADVDNDQILVSANTDFTISYFD